MHKTAKKFNGGMPVTLLLKTPEEKSKYLNELFELTYKKDIIERNSITKDDILHWYNDDGILIIGIQEFLTNPNSLDL